MPKVTINEYENKYNKDILVFKDLNELDLSTSIKYEDLWSWVDYEVDTLDGKVKHILIHVKDGEIYIGEVDDDTYNFLLKENKIIYYNIMPALEYGVDAVAYIEDYIVRNYHEGYHSNLELMDKLDSVYDKYKEEYLSIKPKETSK